ncbi:MAG: Ig-like domain-containing protein [Magnetococcales bacterium]|nr:Ig-like domain-containing protein [Magnetococcales bacterium]
MSHPFSSDFRHLLADSLPTPLAMAMEPVGDLVVVPNTALLLKGELHRAGNDLLLIGPDGERFTVAGYFATGHLATLTTANGRFLLPETVERLLVADTSMLPGTQVAGPDMVTETGAPIGTVGEITGKVTAKNQAGVTRTLAKGDAIFQEDVIKTDGDGLLKLTFQDNTLLQLGKNATVILNKYLYNPAAGEGNFEATITHGMFKYTSGALAKQHEGRHTLLKTPSAQIGVRGSELQGEVTDDGQTTVIHTSGVLDVADAQGQGTVTLLQPGMATVITIGALPQQPFQAPPTLLNQFSNQLPPTLPKSTVDTSAKAIDGKAVDANVTGSKTAGATPDKGVGAKPAAADNTHAAADGPPATAGNAPSDSKPAAADNTHAAPDNPPANNAPPSLMGTYSDLHQSGEGGLGTINPAPESVAPAPPSPPPPPPAPPAMAAPPAANALVTEPLTTHPLATEPSMTGLSDQANPGTIGTGTNSSGGSLANSGTNSETNTTATPTPPSLALVHDTGSSASDGITRNGQVNVTGLTTGALWQYSTDGGCTWSPGTGTSFTVSGEGAHAVLVQQVGGLSSNALHVTVDTTPPTLVSHTALDNTSGTVGSQIVLTLSENVVAGAGNITLSDGTDIHTIPVGNAQVSISGNTLSINLATPLADHAKYNLYLDGGVVQDGAGNAFASVLVDPLVLDLTGTGIHLTAKSAGTYFDVNGDGIPDLTGWIGSGNGLLVLDQNGDGRITNMQEIISEQSAPNTTSSLAALATQDSNQDGRIDASDPAFAHLQVWVDKNQDGISTPDELFSLAQLGIVALNLTVDQTHPQSMNGNTITGLASVTYADGHQGSMAEVQLDFDVAVPPVPAQTAATSLPLAHMTTTTQDKAAGGHPGHAGHPAWDTYGEGFSDLIIGTLDDDPHGLLCAGSSFVLLGNHAGSCPDLHLATIPAAGLPAAEPWLVDVAHDTVTESGATQPPHGGHDHQPAHGTLPPDYSHLASILDWDGVTLQREGNTLKMLCSGSALDLTSLLATMPNIHTVDMTSAGNNTLNIHDIVDFSGSGHALLVKGGSGDVVNIQRAIHLMLDANSTVMVEGVRHATDAAGHTTIGTDTYVVHKTVDGLHTVLVDTEVVLNLLH